MTDTDSEEKTGNYGVGRKRVGISYADVERAAITLLKSSRRPTIETLRQQIGSGAPSTLGSLLNRFWRDLGLRVEGDPVALSRLPAEIAELADGMWQRALALASQSARQEGSEAQARLQEQELNAELRAESFYVREREWDRIARERERALSEARDQLLATIKSLTKEQARTRTLESKIAALEKESHEQRSQITALVDSVVSKRQKDKAGAQITKSTPRKSVTAARRVRSRARRSKPRR